MENGSDACPQAKGIEENLLHRVICRGLTRCLPDKGDVRSLVRTMLAYATSEDELLIEKQSLELSIKELRQKADEAETMRERTEGNTKPYVEQIKKYFASISQLRKRLAEVTQQLESSEDFQNEINHIDGMFKNEEITFEEYDDDIVRYLIDSIRVTDDRKLIINIKGGGSITEELCENEE